MDAGAGEPAPTPAAARSDRAVAARRRPPRATTSSSGSPIACARAGRDPAGGPSRRGLEDGPGRARPGRGRGRPDRPRREPRPGGRRRRSAARPRRDVAPHRAAPVEQGPPGGRGVRRHRDRSIRSTSPTGSTGSCATCAGSADGPSRERRLPVLAPGQRRRRPGQGRLRAGRARGRAARSCSRSAALRVDGLMTVGRLVDDPEAARPTFRRLRRAGRGPAAAGRAARAELSMGMSDDYPVAVEEGATIVRVGRALFGERPAGRRPRGPGEPRRRSGSPSALTPRGGADRIDGRRGRTASLRVRVAAAPVDDAANRALVRLLAAELGSAAVGRPDRRSARPVVGRPLLVDGARTGRRSLPAGRASGYDRPARARRPTALRGDWLSRLERAVHIREVTGSNPVSPTTSDAAAWSACGRPGGAAVREGQGTGCARRARCAGRREGHQPVLRVEPRIPGAVGPGGRGSGLGREPAQDRRQDPALR